MKKNFIKALFVGAIATATITSCTSDDGGAKDDTNPDINNPVSAKYKHRVLVEDFTGTWCGWCPMLAHVVDLIKEQDNSDNFVFSAIHNGDSMTVSGTSALNRELASKIGDGSLAYPFVVVNRATQWLNQDNPSRNIKIAEDSYNAEGVPVGIKIASELTATGGSVNFSIKLGSTYNSGLKYVCYITENNIVKSGDPQQNYTSYYGGGSTLPNFVHHDVFLRATASVQGTAITADQTKDGAEITFNQNVAYTSHTGSVDNIDVVVMVLNNNGDVLNVRKVKANATADYENM